MVVVVAVLSTMLVGKGAGRSGPDGAGEGGGGRIFLFIPLPSTTHVHFTKTVPIRDKVTFQTHFSLRDF